MVLSITFPNAQSLTEVVGRKSADISLPPGTYQLEEIPSPKGRPNPWLVLSGDNYKDRIVGAAKPWWESSLCPGIVQGL